MMRPNPMRSCPLRPKSWLARFRRDKRGIAAVEFALIMPVLVVAYLATVEVSQMIEIDRAVGRSTQTVTNIVAQYATISASQDMPDILNASAAVMAPFPSSGVTVVVSLVTINAAGTATIGWSKALNGTARATGSAITVPAALKVPSTSLVYGEVTYAYTPFADIMKFGTVNMNTNLFMLPRTSTTITLTT